MPNHPAAKKAARTYAAQHGVAYVEALRIVTAQHAAKTRVSGLDTGAALPRPVQIHRRDDGTFGSTPIPLTWDGRLVSAQTVINIAARHGIQVAWRSASDESPATLHVYEPDGLRTVLPGGIVLTVEQMTPRPPHPALAQFTDVTVGDRIRFNPQSGRGWWTVKARSDRFVLAVQQAPFQPKGDLWYTVVDLTGWTHRYNGVGPGVVRSSLNTLGGGWDLGEDGEGCVGALAGLESGEWSLSRRRVMAVDGIEIAPSR